MTENQKALIIFICFMAAFGCAGNGDYEYAKHQEQKQIKHEAAKNEKLKTGLTSHLTQELDTTGDEIRLNWLEKNTDFSLRFHKKRWSCTRPTNYEYNTYKTMREAIDAAINGTW